MSPVLTHAICERNKLLSFGVGVGFSLLSGCMYFNQIFNPLAKIPFIHYREPLKSLSFSAVDMNHEKNTLTFYIRNDGCIRRDWKIQTDEEKVISPVELITPTHGFFIIPEQRQYSDSLGDYGDMMRVFCLLLIAPEKVLKDAVLLQDGIVEKDSNVDKYKLFFQNSDLEAFLTVEKDTGFWLSLDCRKQDDSFRSILSFLEYKDYHGTMFPSKWVTHFFHDDSAVTVQDVQFNPVLDNTLFNPDISNL